MSIYLEFGRELSLASRKAMKRYVFKMQSQGSERLLQSLDSIYLREDTTITPPQPQDWTKYLEIIVKHMRACVSMTI